VVFGLKLTGRGRPLASNLRDYHHAAAVVLAVDRRKGQT
jgi:hypothetical protein